MPASRQFIVKQISMTQSPISLRFSLFFTTAPLTAICFAALSYSKNLLAPLSHFFEEGRKFLSCYVIMNQIHKISVERKKFMLQNNSEHRTHPMPAIDLKFSILEELYAAPSHTADRYQLTNEFPDLINPAHDAITELIGKGYVETIIGSNDIRLTLSGIDAYESEHQRRKEYTDDRAEQAAQEQMLSAQRAKDKKENRRNELIISIVSSLASSVITLLIEHFPEIINEIKSLL